ncbi:hypothetical protein B0H14DRAFT_2657653, partial [Mycena olivaceomarginata]
MSVPPKAQAPRSVDRAFILGWGGRVHWPIHWTSLYGGITVIFITIHTLFLAMNNYKDYILLLETLRDRINLGASTKPSNAMRRRSMLVGFGFVRPRVSILCGWVLIAKNSVQVKLAVHYAGVQALLAVMQISLEL